MKTRQEAAAEVASYAVSFGTFYLLIFLARRSGASGWSGPLGRFARACVTGRQPDSTPDEHEPLQQGDSPTPQAPSALRRAVTLIVCALGIQAAYLCWGVMQETIMTSTYSSGERFSSSKFLVFANRIIALLVALPPLWWEGRHAAARRRAGAPRSAPLYRYSYCSVSNILSSAAQYEALHFVSFPTQVLAKACKMVPVMLMGYVVSGKRYTAWEYVVACGVTAGVVLFKLWETNDAPVKDTQAVGIALIVRRRPLPGLGALQPEHGGPHSPCGGRLSRGRWSIWCATRSPRTGSRRSSRTTRPRP
jgi:adenosine 3'-phospho 5'-phosphosulfate transporter B2